MTEKLKIYVDLDGVLADFDAAYGKIVGTSDKSKWPKDDEVGSFWHPIIRTKRFWLDIPLMKDALVLWEVLRKHHYVSILSSPGTLDKERATVQKRLWVREHLDPEANILLKAAKEKHHYACPNSLLIDDWHKNTRRWTDAGGKVIHHQSAAETIEKLKILGVG